MKVAIVNLGTIVSGDWRAPFVAGRHRSSPTAAALPCVGTAAAAEVESCRRGDRCRRHDRDPRPDRFPRPHHLRRLHAAPAHGGIISKAICMAASPPRSRRPRCTCPAVRATRRREGAGAGGAALLRRLPSRRHARDRGLGHSRTGLASARISSSLRQGRAARQGRLRRGEDAYDYVPLVAGRQGGRHDHHLPHRRLVDPRLRRDHRRSSAEDASARLVPHQWRPDRDAGRGFRARDPRERDGASGLHRRQSAHDAAYAGGSPSSSTPSTASSSPPTRRPAAASCRSACSTPWRIWRASPT